MDIKIKVQYLEALDRKVNKLEFNDDGIVELLQLFNQEFEREQRNKNTKYNHEKYRLELCESSQKEMGDLKNALKVGMKRNLKTYFDSAKYNFSHDITDAIMDLELNTVDSR